MAKKAKNVEVVAQTNDVPQVDVAGLSDAALAALVDQIKAEENKRLQVLEEKNNEERTALLPAFKKEYKELAKEFKVLSKLKHKFTLSIPVDFLVDVNVDEYSLDNCIDYLDSDIDLIGEGVVNFYLSGSLNKSAKETLTKVQITYLEECVEQFAQEACSEGSFDFLPEEAKAKLEDLGKKLNQFSKKCQEAKIKSDLLV